MRTNAFIFSLIALAAPARAVIDDTGVVWQDLGGESKDGKDGRWWYSILGAEQPPYTAAFKNGTIVSSETLWGYDGPLPSDGSGGGYVL